MNKQEEYEIHLTGDTYAPVVDYLARNSVKRRRTDNEDIFEFVRGKIVINENLELRGVDIGRKIREGVEGIITSNTPLAGETAGVL